MPRSQPSTAFGKRSARFRLLGEGREHWTAADEGISVGYRRGKTKSVWYVRRYIGAGKYEQKPIGLADDYQDADGDDILTFYQAQDRAKQRARESAAQKRPIPKRKGFTVSDAIESYIEHYKANSGKQNIEVQRVFDRDVIPKLGSRPVDQLTRAELIRWRDNLIKQKPSNRSKKPIELELPPAELKRRRKATAQRKWTPLRAALNHAFANGDASNDSAWRSVKPLAGIQAPPPSRILTTKECKLSVFKQMEQIFGQAKREFCSSFSYYAACRW